MQKGESSNWTCNVRKCAPTGFYAFEHCKLSNAKPSEQAVTNPAKQVVNLDADAEMPQVLKETEMEFKAALRLANPYASAAHIKTLSERLVRHFFTLEVISHMTSQQQLSLFSSSIVTDAHGQVLESLKMMLKALFDKMADSTSNPIYL